jgi:chromosomal replication initiator protein
MDAAFIRAHAIIDYATGKDVAFDSADVLKAVSVALKVAVKELTGINRYRYISNARQIFYWVCRKYLSISSSQIAKRAGLKDHSTVLHGIKKIDRLIMESDVATLNSIAAVERELAIS